ncbi:hypothetical protein FVE85_2953 [Porphyridium purpureum]|uniref:F-box domain-containing protein n=1 Tax=Porphyridium purpureum TaxID=35688 RepID=A0A5J4YV40_PORPP|nr:hypothetical protein FVE85_2953 [Porphyridium purpureum]|eukprot:POR4652..scf227_4
MQSLPRELLLQIAASVGVKDRYQLAQTCRFFYTVIWLSEDQEDHDRVGHIQGNGFNQSQRHKRFQSVMSNLLSEYRINAMCALPQQLQQSGSFGSVVALDTEPDRHVAALFIHGETKDVSLMVCNLITNQTDTFVLRLLNNSLGQPHRLMPKLHMSPDEQWFVVACHSCRNLHTFSVRNGTHLFDLCPPVSLPPDPCRRSSSKHMTKLIISKCLTYMIVLWDDAFIVSWNIENFQAGGGGVESGIFSQKVVKPRMYPGIQWGHSIPLPAETLPIDSICITTDKNAPCLLFMSSIRLGSDASLTDLRSRGTECTHSNYLTAGVFDLRDPGAPAQWVHNFFLQDGEWPFVMGLHPLSFGADHLSLACYLSRTCQRAGSVTLYRWSITKEQGPRAGPSRSVTKLEHMENVSQHHPKFEQGVHATDECTITVWDSAEIWGENPEYYVITPRRAGLSRGFRMASAVCRAQQRVRSGVSGQAWSDSWGELHISSLMRPLTHSESRFLVAFSGRLRGVVMLSFTNPCEFSWSNLHPYRDRVTDRAHSHDHASSHTIPSTSQHLHSRTRARATLSSTQSCEYLESRRAFYLNVSHPAGMQRVQIVSSVHALRQPLAASPFPAPLPSPSSDAPHVHTTHQVQS